MTLAERIREIPYPSNMNPAMEFTVCWQLALNAAAERLEQEAADNMPGRSLAKCRASTSSSSLRAMNSASG